MSGGAAPRSNAGETEVAIPVAAGTEVYGTLHLPAPARGLVIFAHGSGSSRRSSRNRFVAGVLQSAGFATLLMDLLTEAEDTVDQRTAQYRFDIPFLAGRLAAATRAARRRDGTADLRVGYFGASTGAAAALVDAARAPQDVAAVVSRGGRPDLAGDALALVRAPTLLIVGGADPVVLQLNREAMRRMRAPTELTIVAGATHLFGEPGALDEVARLACEWFVRSLPEQLGDGAKNR